MCPCCKRCDITIETNVKQISINPPRAYGETKKEAFGMLFTKTQKRDGPLMASDMFQMINFQQKRQKEAIGFVLKNLMKDLNYTTQTCIRMQSTNNKSREHIGELKKENYRLQELIKKQATELNENRKRVREQNEQIAKYRKMHDPLVASPQNANFSFNRTGPSTTTDRARRVSDPPTEGRDEYLNNDSRSGRTTQQAAPSNRPRRVSDQSGRRDEYMEQPPPQPQVPPPRQQQQALNRSHSYPPPPREYHSQNPPTPAIPFPDQQHPPMQRRSSAPPGGRSVNNSHQYQQQPPPGNPYNRTSTQGGVGNWTENRRQQSPVGNPPYNNNRNTTGNPYDRNASSDNMSVGNRSTGSTGSSGRRGFLDISSSSPYEFTGSKFRHQSMSQTRGGSGGGYAR